MDTALKLTKLFSRPPAAPEGGAKLVTIAFSHYCEKARWALDLSPWRDVYVEDAHMPAFHIPAVAAYSKVRHETHGFGVCVLWRCFVLPWRWILIPPLCLFIIYPHTYHKSTHRTRGRRARPCSC